MRLQKAIWKVILDNPDSKRLLTKTNGEHKKQVGLYVRRCRECDEFFKTTNRSKQVKICPDCKKPIKTSHKLIKKIPKGWKPINLPKEENDAETRLNK